MAATAGVSVETVYKAFGGKAALLKRVYDVLLVGDEEQIPLRQRPEILAIATEPDPRDKIARYAGIARTLGDRLGPVLAVLLASRGSDPELEDFARTIDAERLSGATGFVAQFADRGLLRTDFDRRHASDLAWTLISPAVYLMLQERGWNSEQYERWLSGALADALLSAPPS